MINKFEWLETSIEYRDIRQSKHGEELRWIVTRETIQNQATGQTHLRSFIRHPGICVIVPFASADEILLLRQFRYAVNEELWELPAGTLAGRAENQRMVATENPADCAARELIEETGFAAGKLEKIAEAYAIPGSGDELMHFFCAYDLTKGEQALDIGEVIGEVRAFTFAELSAMIERGELRDAKTLVGLFHAFRRKLLLP